MKKIKKKDVLNLLKPAITSLAIEESIKDIKKQGKNNSKTKNFLSLLEISNSLISLKPILKLRDEVEQENKKYENELIKEFFKSKRHRTLLEKKNIGAKKINWKTIIPALIEGDGKIVLEKKYLGVPFVVVEMKEECFERTKVYFLAYAFFNKPSKRCWFAETYRTTYVRGVDTGHWWNWFGSKKENFKDAVSQIKELIRFYKKKK